MPANESTCRRLNDYLLSTAFLGRRSNRTRLLLFAEQPPNICNYCQSLPMEKWKLSPLGSLQEHRHRKGCSQRRIATRDLSGPEKVTRERAKSPDHPI